MQPEPLPNKFNQLPEVMFIQLILCPACGKETKVNVPAKPSDGASVIDTPCQECRRIVRGQRNKDGSYRIYLVPTCFPAGTLIETPDGLRDIASLNEGDVVFAFDLARNTLRARRILKACKFGKKQIWEIAFTDGSRLRTTPSHSLRVAQAWKQAGHLREGDLVCSFDPSGEMEHRQVAYSSPTNDVEEVFNLIVEGEFSFVADGVVAHSFSHFRAVRSLLWTIYVTFRRWRRGEPNAELDRGRITVSRGMLSARRPRQLSFSVRRRRVQRK